MHQYTAAKLTYYNQLASYFLCNISHKACMNHYNKPHYDDNWFADTLPSCIWNASFVLCLVSTRISDDIESAKQGTSISQVHFRKHCLDLEHSWS